jgi:hypothetical protein
MAQARHERLEQRLAELERDIERTRDDLRALRRSHHPVRSWRAIAAITTCACLASITLPRLAVVEAQGPASGSMQAPWQIVDASGRPLVSVDQSGLTLRGTLRVRSEAGVETASLVDGVLTLGDVKKGGITTGVGASGVGFVLVRRSSGADGLALGQHSGNPLGMYVIGPDGGSQASLQLNGQDAGQLVLGPLDKGGLTAGVGGSGAGFALVREQDGKDALRIGRYQNAPFAVTVVGADGQTPQASLGLDDRQKGRLRVGDPGGARGVLGTTSSGGVSFALFDGPGSDYRVGLLAASDMSFVRLNKSKVAIHLNVDGNDGAALHLFNQLGNAAASLRSMPGGNGQMTLGNPSGDTTVEAGTTTDGVGIVRAGPRIGGPATNNLTGLPFAIVGKKN